MKTAIFICFVFASLSFAGCSNSGSAVSTPKGNAGGSGTTTSSSGSCVHNIALYASGEDPNANVFAYYVSGANSMEIEEQIQFTNANSGYLLGCQTFPLTTSGSGNFTYGGNYAISGTVSNPSADCQYSLNETGAVQVTVTPGSASAYVQTNGSDTGTVYNGASGNCAVDSAPFAYNQTVAFPSY